MAFELPERGFVFWPVGTGDSSTVVLDSGKTVVQIDLHELECCDDKDDPHISIVNELERLLPKVDDKPYLSTFILTHPDRDHIKGFEELLSKVTIGEIWHTPRVWREKDEDLCNDAKCFAEEAERRRKQTIHTHGETVAGDRVRVIGHDDLFEEEAYKNFPDRWRSHPGKSVTAIDGEDYTGVFEAFIHAPFKDNCDGDRNDTSLALQVTLTSDKSSAKALFLGDHCYPTIKRIFDVTKEKKRERYLEWDVLLCAHHCSKSIMYWRDDPEKGEVLKKEIMQDFEDSAVAAAHIIASAESDFSDDEGKNPPHLKARKRYEEIVDAGHFICTQEHPNTKTPEPITFELIDAGISVRETSTSKAHSTGSALAAAVSAARGGDGPAKSQVGFGRHRR